MYAFLIKIVQEKEVLHCSRRSRSMYGRCKWYRYGSRWCMEVLALLDQDLGHKAGLNIQSPYFFPYPLTSLDPDSWDFYMFCFFYFLGDFWSQTTQGTSMGRARVHFNKKKPLSIKLRDWGRSWPVWIPPPTHPKKAKNRLNFDFLTQFVYIKLLLDMTK